MSYFLHRISTPEAPPRRDFVATGQSFDFGFSPTATVFGFNRCHEASRN
jgi:hypothetical protein